MQITSLTLKQPKILNSPRFKAITIKPQLENEWGPTFRKLKWPLMFKCYDVDVVELNNGNIGVGYIKGGVDEDVPLTVNYFKRDQVKDALKWIITELGITDEFIADLRKKLSKKANSEIEWPIA